MIFFFYGPNTYAARQQLAKLRSEYIKKTGGDLGLERLDGAKISVADLQAALTAAPFLTSSRLVIVEDLGSNKPVSGQIERLLKLIPDSTVAVFYDPSVDRRTSYFKTLQKTAKTVEFKDLAPGQLRSWAMAQAKGLGYELDPSTAAELTDRTGGDQWRLASELAKLANYEGPVTAEVVRQMVEPASAETVFDLVEAMTSARAGDALQLFGQLRRGGMSEVYILSMIIWQLRNLLLAKTAGRINSAQLAAAAGMSPFVAGKVLAKRHLFEEPALKTAFLRAVDTDFAIKTGAGEPEVLVEQLIYKIASQVAA